MKRMNKRETPSCRQHDGERVLYTPIGKSVKEKNKGKQEVQI
jgi:hypothetical protein